jgi:hypothetical protein
MGPYVLALVFLVVGAVFSLFGYSNLVSKRKKRATWLTVEGSVVNFAEELGDHGRTLSAPIYQYTIDGEQYTATSKIRSFPPRYKIGDRITIVVNPTRPNDSDIMDSGFSIFTHGLLAVGMLLLALGILIAWLALTGRMTFE